MYDGINVDVIHADLTESQVCKRSCLYIIKIFLENKWSRPDSVIPRGFFFFFDCSLFLSQINIFYQTNFFLPVHLQKVIRLPNIYFCDLLGKYRYSLKKVFHFCWLSIIFIYYLTKFTEISEIIFEIIHYKSNIFKHFWLNLSLLPFGQKQKGVIHQRRLIKNRLFGPPPPCPTSFVWKKPPTAVTDLRIVSRVDVRNALYIAIRTSVDGGRVSDSDTDSETQTFLRLWTSGIWPTLPPSAVVHIGSTPPLLLTGQL